MTLPQKMRAIREALRLSRLALATEMDYSETTIYSYENGIHRVTDKLLHRFKGVTGTQYIPLTDDEVTAFKKKLYVHLTSINLSDNEKISKFLQESVRCSQWCFDTDLCNLCDLFRVKYHSANGNKEECKKILSELSKRESEFSDEHFYWYYHCLGILEHSLWRYKSALSLYIKAEACGNRLSLDLSCNNRNLFYNIAYCLGLMDYSYLSIEYLEKLKKEEVELISVSAGVFTKRLLAVNLSKLGRTERALKILNNCLDYVMKEIKDNELAVYTVYLDIGKVYQNAGNFDKALWNFDKASQYCDTNSEAFQTYMCYKATLLRTYNKNDMVTDCLDKSLPLLTKGTIWYEWLMAIKHSMELDNDASLKYMEYTAIPNLMGYGRHLVVVECFKWLSSYCEKNIKYKLALEYSRKATKIYEQLMEGDLSL
ncbi:MAG: helix-turn-helix transcriptional regulator [Defluviitaleaceae bacterium]|nr:helix-turn-helix transcriptional regulator [Defluviitaleaceae bacterium]